MKVKEIKGINSKDTKKQKTREETTDEKFWKIEGTWIKLNFQQHDMNYSERLFCMEQLDP